MLIKILMFISVVFCIAGYLMSRNLRLWEELVEDLEEFCNKHEPAIADHFMQKFQSEFPDASNEDHNTAIDFCKISTSNMLMGMLTSINALKFIMTDEGPAIRRPFFIKKSLDSLIFDECDGTIENLGYKEAFVELSASTIFATYLMAKRGHGGTIQDYMDHVMYCDIDVSGLLIPEEKTNNVRRNDV